VTTEFGENQAFNVPQFPQSAFLQDPDTILRYTLEMLDVERVEEEKLLDGLLEMFDVDTCPEKYLPYLADLIGFKPKATDPVAVKRSQIKQAVAWYKAKGQPVAFDIILNAIGYPGRVIELWASDNTHLGPDGIIYHNGFIGRRNARWHHAYTYVPPGPGRLADCARWYEILPEDYTCEDIPPGWNPHSRIDLELEVPLEQLFQRHPEGFSSVQSYLLKQIEEVRPIHVLLRAIRVFLTLEDQYPFDLVSDAMVGIVHGNLADSWDAQYLLPCGLWHFAEPSGFFRDGGGYRWLEPVKGFIAALPATPAVGDRYLYSGKIYEWDGTGWAITIPEHGDALWVQETANREDWFWTFFVTANAEGTTAAEAAGWDLSLRWDDTTGMWDDVIDWDSGMGMWDAPSAELVLWDHIGDWFYGWKLCEGAPYLPPGPYFRDCPCVNWEGVGPRDQLDVIGRGQLDDAYEACYLHDGTIFRRNGVHFHNCNHPYDEGQSFPDQWYGLRHNGFITIRTGDFFHTLQAEPDKNAYHLADVAGSFDDRVARAQDALEIIAIPGTL
jgi:hypothetical protein